MTNCLPLMLLLGAFSASDEAAEPPLLFDVKVGDTTVSLSEGEPGELSGTFEKASVELTIRPYREFHKAGVSFRYPRQYVYEADVADSSFKSWTVEGSNVVVMLFTIDGHFAAQDYVEGFIPQFGADNAQVTDRNATIRLGDSTLKGVRVRVDVGGTGLLQEAYEVPLDDGRGGLLVIQDSLTEADTHTDEYKQTRKLLQSSFRLE